MDNSNKAIAKRINKELRSRDWKPTKLLKKIIEYKNPEISKDDLQAEVIKRKSNFSTTLKGGEKRSFSKEDLYIISKIFSLPLEYIWFGDEKKSGFVPNGARYAAYQDNDGEYRTYIASLEYEDRLQSSDEFGFNLFDYFGQYDSINGYKFFAKYYSLYFDYETNGQLRYINSEGYAQYCSYENKEVVVCDNLLMTLVKYNDVKTFKTIFFDNCSLSRFNYEQHYYRNRRPFSDTFLDTLLRNNAFLELIFKTTEIDLDNFRGYSKYFKGEKRSFIEPMFYEVLSYALKHEEDYNEQLLKLLQFALEYNKSQFEFVKQYLETHEDIYSDVRIYEYDPRVLKSGNGVLMGNIFKIRDELSNVELKNLANEIEKYAFNITHIINEQEKNNEEIKISTPDNPLFMELSEKAIEQNITFVPRIIHANKEFTYFQNYESNRIEFNDVKHLRFVIDCLNRAQSLVASKPNKVLVHGNLTGRVIMFANGEMSGLSEWQKCHYGSKFEDRADLLSNIDVYTAGEEYLNKVEPLFDVISEGFNQEEKIKLIDKAINILNEQRKNNLIEGKSDVYRVYWLKDRASKLEFFKEMRLERTIK